MKTENKFKVGDYVWFDETKHFIGRITKIQVDAGVRWYWFDDLRSKWGPYCAKENQITPVTDSEVAWFLVTNEN